MNEAFSLKGRSYVVTGGARGIGRAIGEAIERSGGTPIYWDVVEATDVTPMDVRSRPAVIEALRKLEDAHGVDGLVLAAGVVGQPGSSFMDIDEDEWNRVVGINMWGVFNVLQEWARLRIAAGKGGSVVNIASIVAKIGTAHNPHYVASKGGVDAMTRSAAAYLGPHGIRVNAIGPGPVATGLNPQRWSTEEGRAGLMKGVLLGRLGEPADISNAAVFYLSDASCWTTGSTLYVDGGVSAGR